MRLVLISYFIFLINTCFSQTTIVIDTNNGWDDTFIRQKDNDPSSANSNYSHAKKIQAIAWTSSGAQYRVRSLIKFDLSQIPSNATILEATLRLNSDPTHLQGYNSNRSTSGSNAFYFKLIEQSWNVNTVTWNNQPSASNEHALLIEQSTSETENINVNLRSFVQYWADNPQSNHGLIMELFNEVYYRSRSYASKDHNNPSIRPSLSIVYQTTVDEVCGTLDTDSVGMINQPWFDNNAYLTDFLDSINWNQRNCVSCRDINGLPDPYFYLPVKFNIYQPENPSLLDPRDYSEADVEEILRMVNQFQEDSGTKLRYYLDPQKVVFRQDDDYYDGISKGSHFKKMTREYYEEGYFNFHFVGYTALTSGRATRVELFDFGKPWSGFMRSYNQPNSSRPRPSANAAQTVAHEFGHNYDLDHTHQPARSFKKFNGNITSKCNQEPVSRTLNQGNGGGFCINAIWRSNSDKCAVNGDRLCDTPGDPGYDNNSMVSDHDLWNDPWQPDETNIMSYYSNRSTFTNNQIGVMFHTLLFHFDMSYTKFGNPDKLDLYEPNNFQPRHRNEPTIAINESQIHTIHDNSDVDWVIFTVTDNSKNIIISTDGISGLTNTDTNVTLYEVDTDDDISFIENDSNDGNGNYAMIERTLSPGKYLVKVEGSTSSGVGYYELRVSECFNTTTMNISGPTTLCSNSNFTLSNVPQNANVTWQVSPLNLVTQASGSGSNITLNPTSGASGIINLAFYVDNGQCSTLAAERDIQVGTLSTYDFNVSGQIQVCPGNEYTYVANIPNSNQYSFQWSYPNGWIKVSQQNNQIRLRVPINNPQGGAVRALFIKWMWMVWFFLA